jgi:hypothetical protein
MAETLLVYDTRIVGNDGIAYEARACAAPDGSGTWQGWIEFVPIAGGTPLRTPRETTQPNRADTIYWATGLTPVYLEGALARALEPEGPMTALPMPESAFDGPAPSSTAPIPARSSVLDPFSVYEKGEVLLRRQLGALSSWHLINIIRDYELSYAEPNDLAAMPAAALIDIIVAGVRSEAARTARR